MGRKVVPMHHLRILAAKNRLEASCPGFTVTGVAMQTQDFVILAGEVVDGAHVLKKAGARNVASLFGLTVTQARHIPHGEFRLEVKIADCGATNG